RGDVAIPQLGGLEELTHGALERRLETRALVTAEQALVRQEQAQKADRYPRLSAFAQANYDRPNQRIVPSLDEFRFTWAAGVQLTWSPNDLLVANTRVDDTEAKLRAIGADRARLSNGVHNEIAATVQQVDIARQALINTQQALVAAEEGYRVRKEL